MLSLAQNLILVEEGGQNLRALRNTSWQMFALSLNSIAKVGSVLNSSSSKISVII